MTTLLELKQVLRSFYVKYEVYITYAWKFLLTLICLLQINGKLGYMAALNSLPIVFMIALLCAILPKNFMVIACAAFVLGHLNQLSRECMVIGLLLFLLMYLLYYRFSPKESLVVLLTPLFFWMHLPYVMPLALGLLGNPFSIFSMGFGIVTYFFLEYVSANVVTLSGAGGSEETVGKIQSILTDIVGNRTMMVVFVAFSVALVMTYVIRRLSIDYAWRIAIVCGSLTLLIALFIGDLLFDTSFSIVGTIIGTVVSALLMVVVEFFAFQLDYKRTEKVQFEDDEYYYYVKAVPKVTLSSPEKKVKKINRAQQSQGSGRSQASQEVIRRHRDYER